MEVNEQGLPLKNLSQAKHGGKLSTEGRNLQVCKTPHYM